MRCATAMALGLFAAACAEDATAIDLRVDSDLVAGVDVDAIRVAMFVRRAEVWSSRYSLAAADAFPWSSTIRPTSEEDSAVELEVVATSQGRPLVRARRQAGFARGRHVEVDVCLWARCAGDQGDGCLEGSCELAEGDGDADDDADAEVDADRETDAFQLCTNDCPLARDDVCDDGGPDSLRQLCEVGTDCQDCGPRAPVACVPRCEARECGPDGCGGTCGPGCGEGQVCAPGGACVVWVPVLPGTFAMGSPVNELGRIGVGEEQHEVTLTRPFVIDDREVGGSWLRSVMGDAARSDPSCGAGCPAVGITWHVAAAFSVALSKLEGLPPCYDCTFDGSAFSCVPSVLLESPYECEGYRLPTEAEWEYAARAGTTTATYNGDLEDWWVTDDCNSPSAVLDPIAWYCANSGRAMHPSAGRLPNALGLYDMLGNAAELVHDWMARYPTEPVSDPWGPAEGTSRILRGGAATGTGTMTRAAFRAAAPDTETLATSVGFRLVRGAP